ncbi:MAG: right-handed parallel beta-helix repeat-containing protein [Planctomycetes bacterium]|nr:right-handed parallel beta-helix repeat-containing protein [Planctomycetota bacterium]
MTRIALSLLLLSGLLVSPALAKDIYVSKTTGSNKGPGTKAAPYKLLWKVIGKLTPGDRVHVAEGVYHGKKKSGQMPKIPVGDIHIIGGYTTDFSSRDPFTHLSVITGVADRQADTREVFQYAPTNPAKGEGPIVLDGFCIDRGPGLYYSGHGEGGTDKQAGYKDTTCWGYQAMNKKKSGSDPAIELLGKTSFTVRNMILINNPWWGISVKAGGKGKVLIENNLILSYRGRGIEAITGGGWGAPEYVIRNNTVAFGSTTEGRALSLDPQKGKGTVLVEKNVLAFGSQTGYMTKFGASALTLNDNLFYGFTKGDAGSGGSGVCNADEFEDELEHDNEGNVHECPKFIAKLSKDYVDHWSQWKSLTSKTFSSDEVMAARKLVGLGAYTLPFFKGKTYESYAKLPPARVNYGMYRYPHHFKEGQKLMDWKKSVLVVIGADGARGIQAFKK